MMIALLRVGALLLNLLVFAGLPLMLGAPPWGALLCALLGFALTWFGCAFAPRGRDAGLESRATAVAVAARLAAPAPRFVRIVPGWTAAAVRSGLGYGLVLGEEVAAHHREAILAHEVAHYLNGDLGWEPFADGPARLLLSASARLPPLAVAAVPFLLLGAPLARATEIEADRRAASALPFYLSVLEEVASSVEGAPTLLYPSLRTRIASSARDSR